MSDEIDIEEHDIVDNPVIKNKFLDLSVLKNETCNYYDEFDNSYLKQRVKLCSDMKPKSVEVINNGKAKCKEATNTPNSTVKATTPDKNHLQSNKIILGSKPNKTYVDQNYFDKWAPYEANIVLQDIQSYLSKSRRYCETCCILFPEPRNFETHVLKFHSQNDISDTLNTTIDEKCEEHRCSICSNTYATKYVLKKHVESKHIEHFENVRYEIPKALNMTMDKRSEEHRCNISSNTCATKKNLKNHTESKDVEHSENFQIDIPDTLNTTMDQKSEQYKCHICSNTYVTKYVLKKHVENKHIEHSENSRIDILDTLNTNIGQKSEQNKCHICSYTYATKYVLQKHMENKHIEQSENARNNITDTSNITMDKRIDEHRCHICSNTYSTEYGLNKHMESKHKKQSANNIDATKCTKNDLAIDTYKQNNTTDLSNTCFHCKKSFDNQKTLIEHLYDILQTKKKTTEIVPVLKSVLFKCNKCDIHFVSSQIAASHTDHMEMLINWKCSICSRIFKKEDELSHERQHSVSNNFAVYNLGEIDVKKILFKCSKCSTHFTEKTFLFHFRDCGLKKSKSSHCKICDILLEDDIVTSHNADHMQIDRNDNRFTVIETEVISDNPVKNMSKEKQLKTNVSDLFKSFREVKIVLKRLEHDELFTHMKRNKEQNSDTNSIKTPKSNRAVKKHSNAVKNQIAHKRAQKILVMKTVPKDGNISKTHKRRIEINSSRKRKITKSDFNYRLHKMSKLAYSYCEYCKCFLTKYRNFTHMQSRCTRLQNRICKHCGLRFTHTSLRTHNKLHEKNKNIKLTNFKFFNLYSGLPMSPPIPEYPKCSDCGVHFLTIASRNNHACSKEAYLTCHICEIKLSEAAFKLHMMFHHYPREVNQTTSSKYIMQSNINLDSAPITCNIETPKANNLNIQNSEMCKSEDASQKSCLDLGVIIYTCRNCHVTVDTYDKVIGHCQGHCNVDSKGTETILCNICQLDIDKESYEDHHNTHEQGRKFNILKFDRYYFPEEHYLWVNHIFKGIPNDEVNEILSKSIYRYEGRIKMDIIQQGAPNLTVYKCDRCCCFIEPNSLFKHADNSCFKLRKHPCSFCGLPYNSSASRADHEKIHKNPGVTPKSYRIVLFNREQDRELNKSFCFRKKYVLYQCRNCNGVIDKLESDVHECDISNLKKCPNCSLLLYNKDFDAHATAHSEFDSFNHKNMKVILLGNVNSGKRGYRSDFLGTIHDYRMYRCNKCQLCIKNEKFIPKHSCYYGRPQSKCPKCCLYFSVSRLKTHLKYHDRDPDYVRSNMTMISFDPSNWDQNENTTIGTENGDCEVTDSNSDSDCDFVMNEENRSHNYYEQSASEKMEVVEEIAKIYKCVCGLHFLNEDSILRHFGVCRSSIRTSKQECSKCNLLFTSNVLFTHMLAHHSSKNRRYKYKIVDRYDVRT